MNKTLSHRALSLSAAALLAALTLTACAEADDKPAANATPTNSAPAPTDASTDAGADEPTAEPTAPAGPTIAVTVKGDKIGPNAEEVTVKAGEPITFTFDTDRAGEFHVHSKPEQFLEFEAGTSTQTLTIDTPGVVEVEEHDSGVAVAVITVK